MKSMLFRAKDRNTEKWCYGRYDRKSENYIFSDGKKHFIDIDTLSQYTGMNCYAPLTKSFQICDLPRREIKIFEGDILKLKLKDINSKANNEIGVVRYCYSDDCFCVYIKSCNCQYKIYMNELNKTSEVIGNVFDDKKIIEESEKFDVRKYEIVDKKEKYLKRNIHELFSRSIEGRRFMRVVEKIMHFSRYADWYISKVKSKMKKTDFKLVSVQDKTWRMVLQHLRIEYFKLLGKRKVFDKCIHIRNFIYKWFRYNLDIILPWSYELSFVNKDKFGLYQQLISY